MANQIQGLKKVAAANRHKAKSQMREAPPAANQIYNNNMLARRPSKGATNTDMRQSTSNIKKQNRVDLIIEQQNRAANS